MSEKVLLIRPKNIYNYNNYPPLNLISIGSALKSSGYDIRIINCALEENPLGVIKEELKDSLFAGISLLTSESPDAYNLIKYIKESSNVPIVVGGWHCTLFPEQMANCDYIDYVVAGEGEEHIIKLAESIKNHSKNNGKVYNKHILDLEKLAMPVYGIDENIEKFITSYLTDKLSEYVRQPMRWLPYESSRGCPSQCTFCINIVTNNNRYRKKSAEKVIFEIEHIVKKYKLSHLKIIDDNFFVDINRVRDICEGMIKKNLHITWDGECRCDYFNDDTLNDYTLSLAKKSGLIQLTLGIESGSFHSLQLMKKGITPQQAECAVKKCNEYGIIARSSFMLEVPGETLNDIKQTISFVNRLRKYPYFTCGAATFRPYPKCSLTEKLLEEGHLEEPKNFKDWTKKNIVDMYTATEYISPWQRNGHYSEKAAYYLNMESAVRLGNHQLNRITQRIKNKIFIVLAKLRNRFLFYLFPLDKKLYKKFLSNFYKEKQDLEADRDYTLNSYN